MYVKYDRYYELVFHNRKFFSATLKNAILVLLLTTDLGCIDPDFGELLVLHRRQLVQTVVFSRIVDLTNASNIKYLKKTEPPALKQQKIDYYYFNEL